MDPVQFSGNLSLLAGLRQEKIIVGLDVAPKFNCAFSNDLAFVDNTLLQGLWALNVLE